MRTLTRLLFASAMVGLLTPVGASDCETWWTYPATFDTHPQGTDGVPRHYVVRDQPQTACCPFGIWWVYEESNGIDGLQRGDEMSDTTCHGMIPSDTIIF